jgi:hypothetical protein
MKIRPVGLELIKIRPVGVELFYADGRTDRQTDMTKLMFALCNIVNAPNKVER